MSVRVNPSFPTERVSNKSTKRCNAAPFYGFREIHPPSNVYRITLQGYFVFCFLLVLWIIIIKNNGGKWWKRKRRVLNEPCTSMPCIHTVHKSFVRKLCTRDCVISLMDDFDFVVAFWLSFRGVGAFPLFIRLVFMYLKIINFIYLFIFSLPPPSDEKAPCQAELDTWVNSIHSACAAAFARHRGKTGTLHLLQEEILRLERSIESVCQTFPPSPLSLCVSVV